MAFYKLPGKPNRDVLQYAKEKNVFNYRIAEALGILPTSFSAKLSKNELSKSDKQIVFDVIDRLAEQRVKA